MDRRLIVAFTAFVELGLAGGDGGLEALGDDLLVEGGVFEAHVHEVLIDGWVAADVRVGAWYQVWTYCWREAPRRLMFSTIQSWVTLSHMFSALDSASK